VLNVNVVAPAICSREALKSMAPGGRIINIASIAALAPRPGNIMLPLCRVEFCDADTARLRAGTAYYATSKAALLALSRQMSLDARERGVAVTCVLPGNVRTEMLSEEEAQRREAGEGLMVPSDVAQTVVEACCMRNGVNVLELTVIPTRQPLVGRG
jgi:NAD(P)-dependent dehydrogenase (short-subunit alcohol dehydrogenase family)